MEEIVAELKKVVPFKEGTSEGDIVLIAIENPKSIVYALVAKIERDETRRDEWWQVTMHLLSVPPQEVTWALREPQFSGKEIFTMGGEGRFMQAVDLRSPVDYNEYSPHLVPSQTKPVTKKTALRRIK